MTNITNQLLGEEVEKLNAGEIYICLMASALHDIGVGVSEKDVFAFPMHEAIHAVASRT